jgi:hypothetical protein
MQIKKTDMYVPPTTAAIVLTCSRRRSSLLARNREMVLDACASVPNAVSWFGSHNVDVRALLGERITSHRGGRRAILKESILLLIWTTINDDAKQQSRFPIFIIVSVAGNTLQIILVRARD